MKLERLRRHISTSLRVGLVAAAVAVGGHFAVVAFGGNFHAVVKGEFYRSAQPTPENIARYVKSDGIRTVLNLRGPHPEKDWYRREVAATDRLGVTHVDFRMSASHELTQDEAARLIEVMRSAEKPLLIHCRAGADRSGLAAALYVAAVAKQGEESAERQLSMKYGHVSLPFTSAFAMNRTFEALEPWLGFSGS